MTPLTTEGTRSSNSVPRAGQAPPVVLLPMTASSIEHDLLAALHSSLLAYFAMNDRSAPERGEQQRQVTGSRSETIFTRVVSHQINSEATLWN